MSLHQTLFGLSIAYSKNNEGMTQVEYLREKLGASPFSSAQVEFSRFLQATKPEWREMAQLFRQTGKAPPLKPGSYKEKVFKHALEVLDHEMGSEDQAHPKENVAGKVRVTKRKLTSSSKATGTSRSTRANKKSNKVIRKRPSSSPPDTKRRRTISSPEKKTGKTAGASKSPDFGAMEKPLEDLMDGFNQVQLQHHSMKNALAEAREASKELKMEKSALESELEHISESLEEQSESLDKLKIENKMFRGKLAARANDTDALARQQAASKKLKTENSALKSELENTKEEHQQKLIKETDRLVVQQKANSVLQRQIVSLRNELEQLSNLNCRTVESFSVQTRLLQEQCKTLISPGATSVELRNPNVVNDAPSKRRDKESHRARRISL